MSAAVCNRPAVHGRTRPAAALQRATGADRPSAAVRAPSTATTASKQHPRAHDAALQG